MQKLRWRRVVSLALLLLGVVLTYTGVVLYLAPSGRIAYWTDWQLLGLDKDQLGSIHTNVAFATVILGVLHTLYNWKAVVSYLRNKARQLRIATPEMIAASALTLLLVVGSALSWPPFAQVMDAGEAVKDWWEEREGTPPYGHAELSSLATVAKKLGMEPGQAAVRLRDEGWVVTDASTSLLDIARENDRSPAALYAVLHDRPQTQKARSSEKQTGHGSGLGKRTLADLCEVEGLEIDAVIARLAERGVEAQPDARLKDLAGQADMAPSDLSAWLSE